MRFLAYEFSVATGGVIGLLLDLSSQTFDNFICNELFLLDFLFRLKARFIFLGHHVLQRRIEKLSLVYLPLCCGFMLHGGEMGQGCT